MYISVKVHPKTSRLEVKRIGERELEVWLTAPADRGKANAQLREVLADFLGVSKGSIRIVKGEASRKKLIEVTK